MDLFGSLASPLPALSDITVNKSNAAAREPVRQSRGPGEGVQMASASVLARMSPSPPQLCVTAHRTSMCFFTGCFRCWTKQPQTGARTTARCTAETDYQCHHVLRALNTATVFFFFCCHLSLSLPLSVWTDPLLVQLSLANACKEKWPRLKVMGGTGVLLK